MPEALFLLLAVLLCGLGFALLALTQDRHYERVFDKKWPAEPVSIARKAIALIAIGLALPLCVAVEGAGFGSLLWGVTVMGCAMTVALTLTWRPQWLRVLGCVVG